MKFQEYDARLRQLQGQIEEVNHHSDQIKKDLQGNYNDLAGQLKDTQDKVRELEARLTAQVLREAAPQQQPATAAVSAPLSVMNKVRDVPGQTADVSKTAEAAKTEDMKVAQVMPQDTDSQSLLGSGSKARVLADYEQAFDLLKQGKYNSAQLQFETFLKNNPKHALASNAKYWLGETYYARGDYSQAARVFAEGFQEYPKGTKAPDNLLKLGLTLEALGKKQDACIALKQVKKEFSQGAGSVLNRVDKELARLGC